MHLRALTQVLRGSDVKQQCLSFFTALTVKFLTRRFISEYDPNLGKVNNLETLLVVHS